MATVTFVFMLITTKAASNCPSDVLGDLTYNVINLWSGDIFKNLWEGSATIQMGDLNTYNEFTVIHPVDTIGWVDYDLNGEYESLSAIISLAWSGNEDCVNNNYDAARQPTPVEFRFIVDNVVKYISQPFQGTVPTYDNVNIDLTGANTLRILPNANSVAGSNHHYCDHATIANTQLIRVCTDMPTQTPSSIPTNPSMAPSSNPSIAPSWNPTTATQHPSGSPTGDSKEDFAAIVFDENEQLDDANGSGARVIQLYFGNETLINIWILFGVVMISSVIFCFVYNKRLIP